MKPLFPTALVLCTAALFVALDAAPVLDPSSFEAEIEAELGRQQSDEMAKTFLNVFSKILTAAGDRIGRDGSIQAGNELGQTFLNIVGSLLSAASKNADPNDQLQRSVLDGFSSILSSIGKRFGEGGRIQADDDKMFKTFMNLRYLFETLLSAETKRIEYEYGEIQSLDEIMPAFLNLFRNGLSLASKNVDPNDDVAKSFFDAFNTILSALGRKFTSDGESAIQSDDNGLLGAFLNLLGTAGSALQKKASPNDDVAQTFLSLFNTLVSGARSRIGAPGGGQEVRVDTLPATYTAKHFDQSVMEAVDENVAAMAESDVVDLSAEAEEAKTQLWGALLGSLAAGVLNRYLSG